MVIQQLRHQVEDYLSKSRDAVDNPRAGKREYLNNKDGELESQTRVR